MISQEFAGFIAGMGFFLLFWMIFDLGKKHSHEWSIYHVKTDLKGNLWKTCIICKTEFKVDPETDKAIT